MSTRPRISFPKGKPDLPIEIVVINEKTRSCCNCMKYKPESEFKLGNKTCIQCREELNKAYRNRKKK